jgi:hypothetical protein
MLVLWQRSRLVAPRLPAVGALRLLAPYGGRPPAATSALSRLFCSTAGEGGGDGASDGKGGKGRGSGKVGDSTPSDKAERLTAEGEPASHSDKSAAASSGGQGSGDGTAAPKPPPGALVPIDPSNISTLPPVLIFPFPTRPLFPGVYQPAEVTDEALAKALMAVKVGCADAHDRSALPITELQRGSPTPPWATRLLCTPITLPPAAAAE